MPEPYKGGCACGAIRYEVAAEPIVSGHCQCRDCQKTTGTGHASFLGFPSDAVRVTGTPRFYTVKADSGHDSSRGFCTECGSFVLAKGTGMAHMLMVTASSLDDPSRFAPQLVVYTSRAHGWDRVDSTLPSFPRMPPMG